MSEHRQPSGDACEQAEQGGRADVQRLLNTAFRCRMPPEPRSPEQYAKAVSLASACGIEAHRIMRDALYAATKVDPARYQLYEVKVVVRPYGWEVVATRDGVRDTPSALVGLVPQLHNDADYAKARDRAILNGQAWMNARRKDCGIRPRSYETDEWKAECAIEGRMARLNRGGGGE